MIGHFSALALALASVALCGAWNAPSVNATHGLEAVRFAASLLAVVATAALNLFLRTAQPASLATALLITLGAFQSGKGALDIAVGVLMIALLGIPLRHLGVRRRQAGAKEPLPPA